MDTTCVKEPHIGGSWETEDGIQVKRCVRCNLIICTAEIPPPHFRRD